MIDLQSVFLNQMRKEKIPVTIFLIKGFQMRGTIKGFDNFSIVLEFEGKQEIIFKSAISTIMPMRPLDLIS